MCARWRKDFAAFLADMGPAPHGYTLDRIDVNGNYEPGNCRWASKGDQIENRRNARLLTVNGVTRTLGAWAHEANLPYATVLMRIRRGWTPERAVSVPTGSPYRHCPTCHCYHNQAAVLIEDFVI